jgi:hypothetical protein
MPLASSPLRLDADLVKEAGDAAPSMSRSVAQQIAYWARLGRELERSPDVSLKAVAATLAGRERYDSLTPKDQAVVRALWDERMRAIRDSLDLEGELVESGYRFAELGPGGDVVMRGGGVRRTSASRRHVRPRSSKKRA